MYQLNCDNTNLKSIFCFSICLSRSLYRYPQNYSIGNYFIQIAGFDFIDILFMCSGSRTVARSAWLIRFCHKCGYRFLLFIWIGTDLIWQSYIEMGKIHQNSDDNWARTSTQACLWGIYTHYTMIICWHMLICIVYVYFFKVLILNHIKHGSFWHTFILFWPTHLTHEKNI